MNKKENITISNPMDGDVTRCKCCHTKNDVRDIEFHGYNLTDVVSLCAKCRKELAEKLKLEEAQRDYEQSVEYAQYCERYEPTYNPEDGSM